MTSDAGARFEPVATEAAAVRGFVRRVLSDWGVDSADVVLLANELATNSFLHARGPFDILLHRNANRLRVSVSDENTRLPEFPRVPPDALSGRGLAMVAALAADWGIDSLPGTGKTIWFEVDLPQHHH
ncbi:MAG: ATP-binding protein [Acidimicrobiaceae bacterium]|nr:ATP-binding protein [Acidimicrobiaceae bacterium]MBO0747374.1 ATP-binding protein [Acidimicrobiaceae bacterium]